MKQGYRVYELTEVGLTGVPPVIVTAKHPRAAVEEEYGAVFYAGGTLLDGNGPIRFGSKLLDRDRIIYIEVRELAASALDTTLREPAPEEHEDYHVYDVWDEPDGLGG